MDEPEAAEAAPRRGPAPTKHLDILWAAAQLFAQRGVAQTSTREIAAAAQTTERTLFKHYGTKDALVRAVVDQAVLPHLAPTSLQALRRLIAAHAGDLQAWHRALLRSRMQALARAPELTRLLLVELLRDEALRGRFAGQWLEAVWQPLLELFAALQAEGRLAADTPPATLVRLFLSLNLGYLVARHVLAPGQPWDDEAEIAAVARLFARGAAPG
ncbi:MAG: TetR/AcrR family transcriptional regulator [Rubrivivax sp.]|nr:TetR/AcrR family transcriptional regulator [Rubrivivax sp.]